MDTDDVTSQLTPTAPQLVRALGQWLVEAAEATPDRLELELAGQALAPLLFRMIAEGDPTAKGPTMRLLLTLLAEEAEIRGLIQAAQLARQCAAHHDPAGTLLQQVQTGKF